MTALDLSDLFQIGVDILKTTISTTTKKILANTGNVTAQTSDSDNVEWWQHVGFASRPSKPNAGKAAAQAVVVRQGTLDVAIASQDLRGLGLYGALAEGETCLYAAGSDGTAQARVLLKKDGSINLFTKQGNSEGGTGMGVFINPDGSISIASANKTALLINADGGIQLFNSSGGVQVKADGSIKLASGAKVEISGGSITMGGPAALPLAVAPQVVAALGILQTQITAVAAALVAVASIPGPVLPPHAAAAAAGVAATTAGTIAGAAINALIPTKRTSAD